MLNNFWFYFVFKINFGNKIMSDFPDSTFKATSLSDRIKKACKSKQLYCLFIKYLFRLKVFFKFAILI